jgi:signal recognition particle subunit SRP19
LAGKVQVSYWGRIYTSNIFFIIS